MDDLDKFKQSLQEQIWNAYDSGLQLPDGCVAFFDQQSGNFVDGATLQPLQGETAAMATEAFDALTPQEQTSNASYLAACALYRDAEQNEAGKTAADFNAATQNASPDEAEPVRDIIRRLFRPSPAPKI
jgi:hypothetical protein